MNPVTVVTNALQSIPPQVRKLMLLGYAVVVLLAGLLASVGVDWDWEKITVVLTVIGGYLGVQSGANVEVPAKEPGGNHVAPPPAQPGPFPEPRGGEDGTPN